MISWRGALMVLLLIGAAVSGWALWSQRQHKTSGEIGSGQPDYILNNFEVVVLNNEGKESFTLRAPKLTRDPTEKTMDIATPLFLIPAAPGSKGGPWEVRSQTGWVSGDANELRLRGQVTADSTREDGKPIKLATEQLDVFPNDDRAQSQVAVTVTQPGLILNGHHLEANLKTKDLQLKDTKARYERSAQ